MPPTKPVEPLERVFPGWTKTGGTSDKAKEIRSVTPEGFSKAVFVGNMPE